MFCACRESETISEMSDRQKSYINIPTLWVLSVVAALAVAWSVMYIFTLPMGDDLIYTSILRRADGIGTGAYAVWEFPRYWARHWMYTNGRSANLFASLFMGILPHWMVSVMCGLAVGAMYLLVLYFCRLFPCKGRGVAATVVIAVIAFLFPWWDSFSLIDVNFNYVWATAMPLAFLLMLRHDGRGWLGRVGSISDSSGLITTACVAMFCLFAGMIHEAATLSLCAGIAWMAWMRGDISSGGWRRMSRQRRWMLVAFFAGAAVAALSPGIIMRAVGGSSPDDVWWVVVLKSAPITLILLFVILMSLMSHNGRERLRRVMVSDRGMWVVSAIAGLAFVAVGGIVGRSGWFSQIFALIALWQWYDPVGRYRVSPVGGGLVALSLGLSAVGQMVDVDRYSYIGWKADSELRSLYAASPDGIVCYDMPDDSRLPLWVFSRVRYLRPEDDYTHYGLRLYYKKDCPLVNLPASAAAIDWANFRPCKALKFETKYLTIGSLALVPPADAVFPESPGWARLYVGKAESAESRHFNIYDFGSQYCSRNWVIPFEKDGRTYYYTRPYRPHWGDRF